MPRCLEPGQRFPLVLKGDRDKPEESRPTFYFKGVPARKYLNAGNSVTEGGTVEAAIAFLKESLVDWKHMATPEGEAIAFDKDKLDTEVCDVHELWELFLDFRLGAEDKKKYE